MQPLPTRFLKSCGTDRNSRGGRMLEAEDKVEKFDQIAKTERPGNVMGEFWFFLHQNKKWWLLPIVVMLLAFGVLVMLSGTAAAPFIYTLF
jgi:hypothetical protein